MSKRKEEFAGQHVLGLTFCRIGFWLLFRCDRLFTFILLMGLWNLASSLFGFSKDITIRIRLPISFFILLHIYYLANAMAYYFMRLPGLPKVCH
jgi:hypothetical protein